MVLLSERLRNLPSSLTKDDVSPYIKDMPREYRNSVVEESKDMTETFLALNLTTKDIANFFVERPDVREDPIGSENFKIFNLLNYDLFKHQTSLQYYSKQKVKQLRMAQLRYITQAN